MPLKTEQTERKIEPNPSSAQSQASNVLPGKEFSSTKEKNSLSKKTIGILRTTLRNNIELTHLADNKANVLLSLNAIMLTFLVPLTIPNIDLIEQYHLEAPILILVVTCLSTVYLSVLVLKPGKFSGQRINIDEDHQLSPFFFGNFERMTKDEFLKYSDDVLSNASLVKSFLSNDFYHIGLRLAEKMKLMRRAFNIFMIGLASSIIISFLLIITN